MSSVPEAARNRTRVGHEMSSDTVNLKASAKSNDTEIQLVQKIERTLVVELVDKNAGRTFAGDSEEAQVNGNSSLDK